MKLLIYSSDARLTAGVERDVRAICARRTWAKGSGGGRVALNQAVTNHLVSKLVEAATHAVSRPIPEVPPVTIPTLPSRSFAMLFVPNLISRIESCNCEIRASNHF